MKGANVTQQRLREALHYDQETGLFTWRITNSRRRVAGSPAGCRHKVDGRIYIGLDSRIYKAHRLAWLYVYGAWPTAGIDHRDGNVKNNAIANLREATQAQNSQNIRRAHRDSSTGLLGVQRKRNRFFAQLRRGDWLVFGKKRDAAQEAHADYLEIKAIFHPFSTLAKDLHV